ncbi:hypothetical protein ABIA35_008741 [Catenulispora sp. MAP12-49]|uniref:hypothetical protein n=1 Tax=Catenulispora sp. MAP12-49 TaxID=3156302 RepID=UPI003512A8BD
MAYPWDAALNYLSAAFMPIFGAAALLAALAGLAVCLRMTRRRPEPRVAPIPRQRTSHEGVTRR